MHSVPARRQTTPCRDPVARAWKPGPVDGTGFGGGPTRRMGGAANGRNTSRWPFGTPPGQRVLHQDGPPSHPPVQAGVRQRPAAMPQSPILAPAASPASHPAQGRSGSRTPPLRHKRGPDVGTPANPTARRSGCTGPERHHRSRTPWDHSQANTARSCRSAPMSGD